MAAASAQRRPAIVRDARTRSLRRLLPEYRCLFVKQALRLRAVRRRPTAADCNSPEGSRRPPPSANIWLTHVNFATRRVVRAAASRLRRPAIRTVHSRGLRRLLPEDVLRPVKTRAALRRRQNESGPAPKTRIPILYPTNEPVTCACLWRFAADASAPAAGA